MATGERARKLEAPPGGGASKREARDGRVRTKAKRGQAPAQRAPVGGKRHQGRILALQLLYELDIAGHGVDEVLARTFAEQATPADVRAHVERLVRGVLTGREEIDPYIAAAATAFPVPQLPAIDRNVLRLAVYELLREPDVPSKAAINEAVELAKRFGGDNSGRFVNGVLGTLVERIPRLPSAESAGPVSPS